MKTKPRVIIQIQENDSAVVEVELTQLQLDFYKKETGHKRLSARGLSKFFNQLVKLFCCY